MQWKSIRIVVYCQYLRLNKCPTFFCSSNPNKNCLKRFSFQLETWFFTEFSSHSTECYVIAFHFYRFNISRKWQFKEEVLLQCVLKDFHLHCNIVIYEFFSQQELNGKALIQLYVYWGFEWNWWVFIHSRKDSFWGWRLKQCEIIALLWISFHIKIFQMRINFRLTKGKNLGSG